MLWRLNEMGWVHRLTKFPVQSLFCYCYDYHYSDVVSEIIWISEQCFNFRVPFLDLLFGSHIWIWGKYKKTFVYSQLLILNELAHVIFPRILTRICLPMQETQIWSLSWEDPLEKEMATHSSILAWRIPWIEEPGGLWSMGLQKSWIWLSN